jgi:hypothetical protein
MMKLTEPFSYVDPGGLHWDAPTGSIVDGASIPQIGWTIIGGPFEGKYRNASVIHDVACVKRDKAWEQVHYMFYTAMIAGGVERVRAKIMYAAVYHFGPRWPSIVTTITPSVQMVQTCTDILGKTVCNARPKITNQVVRTEVPPPPVTLDEKRFSALAQVIQNREPSAAGSMPLEEIRNFK